MFAHAAARMARWPQHGPFPEVLQIIRHLLIRSGCFGWSESCGWDLHPRNQCTFARHTAERVEPLAWLTDVLERMVSGRTKAHELERLLPWAWKAERLPAPVEA